MENSSLRSTPKLTTATAINTTAVTTEAATALAYFDLRRERLLNFSMDYLVAIVSWRSILLLVLSIEFASSCAA